MRRELFANPKLSADAFHDVGEAIAVERLTLARFQHEALAMRIADQFLHRPRQPQAMALRGLGSGPAQLRHRLARQLPPTVADVFPPQPDDFTRPLSGEQD